MRITNSTKTASEKNFVRGWKLIDLDGKVLGRVANEIAQLLQGKHRSNYSPNIDLGDNIVLINARKIVVTGSKVDDKEYTNYSGYPGGMRTVSYKAMMEKNPTEIIRHAVSGMLPKNKLRDRRLARLYIFPAEKHTFTKQLSEKTTE